MNRIPASLSIANFVPLIATGFLHADPPRVDAQGDPLPEGAILRIGNTRFRAGEPMAYPVVSPDGKLLAAAGSRSIYVWDLQTGRIVRSFRAQVPRLPYSSSSVLAFSPDGKQLAYLSRTEVTAHVVDLASGRVIASLGKGRFAVVVDGTASQAPLA